MATRKASGSGTTEGQKTQRARSPQVRTYDVARSAASTFESLPDSSFTRELKMIAVLLRFFYGYGSRSKRSGDADQAFAGLLQTMRGWRRMLYPEIVAQPAKTNGELLEELEDLCDELRRRVSNYLNVAEDSQEAADEGLVLAVKGGAVLSDAHFGWQSGQSLTSMQHQLERAGA